MKGPEVRSKVRTLAEDRGLLSPLFGQELAFAFFRTAGLIAVYVSSFARFSPLQPPTRV